MTKCLIESIAHTFLMTLDLFYDTLINILHIKGWEIPCSKCLRDLLCLALIACVMVHHILRLKMHSIYGSSLYLHTSPFRINSYSCSLGKHTIKHWIECLRKVKVKTTSNLIKEFSDSGIKSLLEDLCILLFFLFTDWIQDWVHKLVLCLSSA